MAKTVTITRIDIKTGARTSRTWIKRDPATDYANKKYIEVRDRLSRIYTEARQDLMWKQYSFMEGHRKRADIHFREMQAGLITPADYQAWLRGQVFQQHAWELKRGQLARMMANIDQTAMALVNGGRMDIFAENANWMLYKIEQTTGLTTSFGVLNRDALARLIVDNPRLLPLPEIDERKDQAWYDEIITNSVTQGILQGESINQIAARIAEDTSDKAYNSVLRNARTAYTGAQNAGALLSMRRARDELGISIKKRWMATLDGKTRDSHAHLDGKSVDIDDPFKSKLGPIMFPGDPSAEAANVYNCRCGMDEVFPGYSNTMFRTDADGNFVGDVTYAEWKKLKAAKGEGG